MSSGILGPTNTDVATGHPAGHLKLRQLETPLTLGQIMLCTFIITCVLCFGASLRFIVSVLCVYCLFYSLLLQLTWHNLLLCNCVNFTSFNLEFVLQDTNKRY